MTKKDKLNLITRIFLCALSFILGAYGYTLYLNGYGETGRIRQELIKVIDIFNELETVKNNIADIQAKYSNKSIVVSYKTDSADIEYVYKYEKNNNHETIIIEYSTSDATRAEDVTKNILDAISVQQGNNPGDLFQKYKYSDFYKTSIEQGAYISNYNGKVITRITLNANLLQNLEDTFIGQEIIVTYISQEDLKNFKNELTNNKKYSKEKNSILIYVIETDTEYTIYSSDKNNNDNNLYESIMSAIYHLDENTYNEILKTKTVFNENFENEKYKIEINPQTIETDQQMTSDYIIKFTLKK